MKSIDVSSSYYYDYLFPWGGGWLGNGLTTTHLPLYIDYGRLWLWLWICSVYVLSSIPKMENIVKYFITCK